MNILYISPSIKVRGGISTVLKGYLSSSLINKHNLYIVASHIDGNKFFKFIKALTGLIEVLYFLVLKEIDIVHIHCGDSISFKRKYFYIMIVSLFPCKIIYHHHGGGFIEQFKKLSKIWQNRVRRTWETVDLVICLSTFWRKNIKLISPNAKVLIVPNGIHIPPNYIKNNKDYIKISFLGLIAQKKGIYDLLRVFKRIINEGYNVKLTIGGSGEGIRLRKEISMLKLDGKVQYLGWIHDTLKDFVLKETDIFVLPSYFEALPMSVIEAMSYSIPVVSTTVGGIPELVVEGKTGLLVEPGDLEALYQNIIFLIQNKNVRENFGNDGRQLVIRRHNIEKISQKINSIYQSFSVTPPKISDNISDI